MHILNQIPVPAVFVLTVLIVLASVECGFRLGRFVHTRVREEASAPTGEFVASTISLLAFMLAFTFGIAGERFNDRRVLVIEEANAIGKTFLRADFLPPEARREVRNLLRDYVDTRLTMRKDAQSVDAGMRRSSEIQQLIWARTVGFARADLNSDIGALFIDSLNETIDLQTSRLAAFRARLPGLLWAVLFFLTYFGMFGMGYRCGLIGVRDWTTVAVLSISFSLVITVITDLDRPMEGSLTASQQSLKDLRAQMGPPEAAPSVD